jgi:MFS transporter, DHA1 family, multidrug resistance protein
MQDPWRRYLYVIAFANFVSIAGSALANPFLPLFINRDLGVADPGLAAVWAGFANAGSGIMQALMAPIWGILADRYGRKAMLVRAQFGQGLLNMAGAVVVAPWQLATTRITQGAFSGTSGAARALTAGAVPREHLPYAMGVLQSSYYMGQTLGPAIGGVLGSLLGFRVALFANGLVNTLAGVGTLLYLRELRTEPLAQPTPVTGPQVGALRELFASRGLSILATIFFLSMAATQGTRPILPLLLSIVGPSYDAALLSGIAFAVLGGAGAVSAVLSGQIADRVGPRLLLLASIAGAAILNGGIAVAPNPVAVVALLFGVGACQGTLVACGTALVGHFSPPGRQGTTFGIISSAESLGNAAGPLITGVMAAQLSLHASFIGVAATMVLAVVLGLFLPSGGQGVQDIALE